MAYKHVIRAKTKNLLNITPSMCKQCTYKDGILKANVVNFYYALLQVTDLFEIGNTYTVSWDIIHKKSYQTAGVVVYGKSKTDPDKTVLREYRSAITGNEYTFTINDEDFSSISFVELRFFRYDTITTDTESSILNIQVELGLTPTPYTPYNYLQSNKRMIKVSDVCQLLDKRTFPATTTINGVTFTNNGDGLITVDGTATSDVAYDLTDYFSINMNHKYIILESNSGTGNRQAFISTLLDDNRSRYGGYYPSNGIFKFASYNGMNPIKAIGTFYAASGETFTNRTISNFMLFDLTAMYGAGNEPATVAEFRQRFPNELYPYSPQCWLTSYKSAVVCKTKNLCDFARILTLPLDKQFESTGFSQVEINVEPNTQYTLSRENNNVVNLGGATYLGMDNVSRGHHPGGFWLNHESLPSYCKQQITIESNADGKLWIFFSNRIYIAYKNGQNLFGYLQLEQGSTATSYVPYQHL